MEVVNPGMAAMTEYDTPRSRRAVAIPEAALRLAEALLAANDRVVESARLRARVLRKSLRRRPTTDVQARLQQGAYGTPRSGDDISKHLERELLHM
jgi:hypothetical protein